MREMAHAWLFKLLMVILVLSFGIWGIGDIFRGNPLQDKVAKAGSKSITVQEFSHEFEHNLSLMRRNFGPDMTAQQAKAFGILDMTLNSMVDKTLLDQSARKLNLDVGEQSMMDVFAAIPQFHDKDGKFDKNLARQALEHANLNEQDFIKQQRAEATRHLLIDAFSDDDPLPNSILDPIMQARGQKRILNVITLRNDSITNVPTPNDKELKDFYAKNPKQFTAPEYRGITIAELSTEAVAKDIAISDEDIKKEYETRSAQLERPERRSFLQVVTPDEAKAKQVAADAKEGGDLAAAAKKNGLESIPLEESDKRSLMGGLADPAFALKDKQISDPLHSSLGWHVLQLQKIIPAGKPTFDSLKDDIRDSLRLDRSADAVAETNNKLEDELAAGHNLDDIADALKLRLIKIPAIDSNGKTPDGKPPAELPDSADVLKAAFGQNSGETSPTIDDKNGNYLVVRTDNVTPSAVKPFDTITADVAAAWKAEAQDTRARAEAEQIAKDLRGGKPISSIRLREGLEIHQSKPISQIGDEDPELPPGLMPNILKMKKGDVVSWPLTERQLVLRVSDIVPVDPDHDEIAKGRVTQDLNDQMPKELISSYVKYLRTVFAVEIHQELVDNVVQTQSN